MKKLVISLFACLAIAQFSYAATSALTESLLEYEAITSALGTNPDFQNVIGPSEFIIDIKRISHDVDTLGVVKYQILTRVVGLDESSALAKEAALESHSRHGHRHHLLRNHKDNTYIATLDIAANPGIGPNIITVVKISAARSSVHTFSNIESE